MAAPNENLFSFKKSNSEQLFAFKKQEEPGAKLFNLQSEANIFDESSGAAPKTDETDIIKGILKTEDAEERKPLLGPLPKIDMSMFIDEEYHAKQKLFFAKGAFATIFMIALCTWGYFHIQLSPTFDLFSQQIGQNVTQTLRAKTEALQSSQTQLNAKRYLITKVHLDNFTYYADEFLKRYEESKASQSESKKAKLEEQLTDLKGKLQTDFEAIRANISEPNYVEVYRENDAPESDAKFEFNQMLLDYFEGEKAKMSEKDPAAARFEIKEANEIISLIDNAKFESIFQGDFNSLTNEDIKDLIGEVNGVVRNEFSILHSIMAKKINWANVISEIENVTSEVDKDYGSGYFEQIGGIAYTGYDFDSASSRVSITGQTKRDDATNFTLIANLIDKLESSEMFKDVNMRSFTKSGSVDSGYVATLKLDFFLQNDEESSSDEKENPLEVPEDLL